MPARRSTNEQPRLLLKRRLTDRPTKVLFLPSLLAEEARKAGHLYREQLDQAHDIIRKWGDMYAQGRLDAKETTLDADFLLDIFGRALGYVTPAEGQPSHQLERNYSVPGVGTADGALGTFSTTGKNNPIAVIELKSANTDLDLDRFNGRTPVQQCWDYLNALPQCPWGLLSNFVTIRLYHREAGSRAYEEFSLSDLVGAPRFQQFYFLLGQGGLLSTRLCPTPRALALFDRTGKRQREVGDELYATYSQTRLEMIRHLHHGLKRPVDKAIATAQRILDRIVFIAFCEDRGLLPGGIIDSTFKNIPPLSRDKNPKWRNFLDLFTAVDKGHKNLSLNGGYNGGLFRYDPDVDDLQLDDEWTGFFQFLSRYDFRDEVNVDVLGHLFEKSVTELEKLKSGGFFQSEVVAPSAMKKSALRKRFGIYYTPPEFTAFIVERTVGALLAERFGEIARRRKVDPLNPNGQPDDVQRGYWRECFDCLSRLTVCDPACGSGAFLIRAYDYLADRYAEVVHNLMLLDDPDAEDLAERVPDLILGRNLHGVDVSYEAVEITQLALWIRSAQKGKTLADLSRNVVCGNSLVDDPSVAERALVWRDAFPEVFANDPPGFDCVIGNPPWERLKLQEREFFALSAPDIAGAVSAARRRTLIADLDRKDPKLHQRHQEAASQAERTLQYARRSGRYPLTGRGDINTYVLFAELARNIVAPSGRVGLLVPSGIASDNTTKTFFNRLMADQALIGLYDFENRRGLFPDVHRSFKFSTLVFGGSAVKTPAADFVFFAHDMEELDEPKRHIPLSVQDMALVNPNTGTCPVFRSRRDADLTRDIYRRVPVLIDKNRKRGGNPWGVKFVRMFDQTNDAELFHTAERLQKMGFKLDGNRWKKGRQVFLPLYEAKMVQAYDHRAAGIVVQDENWVRQGQTEPTPLVRHQNPEFVPTPRWWVDATVVDARLGALEGCAFLCYKDVTSPTNERTMIASFIPRSGVVNSAPLVLCGQDVGPPLQCCLLANLNSFALDFVARQKVGNVHLNFFIVEQLPFLPPEAYGRKHPWTKRQTLERWVAQRVLKLTCTADDMRPLADAAGFKGGVHRWDPTERAQLRAELDAAYFLLYGIERDDVEYILSTFTGTRRRDERERGAFHTAELILNSYDALRSA